MDFVDELLRERLLLLAREALTNLPGALDAFEAELAKPNGGAIGARVRLLDLTGWRLASVTGDADKFDHKLQPLIDAWRTVFDALRALEPPLQPVREDSGVRAPAPTAPELEREAPAPAARADGLEHAVNAGDSKDASDEAQFARTPQTIIEHRTKREESERIAGALRALDESEVASNAEAPAAVANNTTTKQAREVADDGGKQQTRDAVRWGTFNRGASGDAVEDETSRDLTLPVGTKHVPFRKLPRMIAEALHRIDAPDEDLQFENGFKIASAELRLDTELVDDARAGRLKVLDPLTFGRHNFTKDSSLPDALVKVSDLQEYLSGRGIQVRLPVRLDDEPIVTVPQMPTGTAPALPQTPLTDAPQLASRPSPSDDAAATGGTNRRARQSLEVVAGAYIRGVWEANKFGTVKALEAFLMQEAGTPESPFDRGTGTSLHSLVVRRTKRPVATKTLQNMLPKILAQKD